MEPREFMLRQVEELNSRKQKIRLGGGIKQIELQHAKGKLTAREKIDKLFDPNTFVELNIFAKSQITAFDMDKRETPADGVIVGYGKINGRDACCYATDFTVMAGATGEAHAIKIVKTLDWAATMMVPVIGLVDSAGARIEEVDPVIRPYGHIFQRHSLYSGVIPQITALMGPCAAGQAYSPALTDFIIMVKGTSYMWLGGPRLTKAATGQDVTDETLGGPEVHMKISGTCDLIAENDEDCLRKIKGLLSFLPQNYRERPPLLDTGDDPERTEESLLEILPDSNKRAYDMYHVIHKIVDNGEFFDIKPDFAKNIIVGFARMGGQTVGIIANQPLVLAGGLEPDSSDKYTRFLTFCDAFNIPIITIVDTPAFMVGKDYEYRGVIRHGAKILYAYSVATVPKITLVIRKSYGGANMVMGSRSMGADFCFAWPTAEVCIMGPEGAAAIIYRKEIAAAENPEALRQAKMKEYWDTYINPYMVAGNMRYDLIDDIIDPRQTRPILIKALRVLANKRAFLPEKRHGNPPV